MKLIRFSVGDAPPRFGVVVAGHAVAFDSLQARCGQQYASLANSKTYLAALPESEAAAGAVLAWGEANLAQLDASEKPALGAVPPNAPVEVAALVVRKPLGHTRRCRRLG